MSYDLDGVFFVAIIPDFFCKQDFCVRAQQTMHYCLTIALPDAERLTMHSHAGAVGTIKILFI